MKLHAFSLVELLVVISILGILSAIAIPAYKNYQTKAKITNIMSRTAELANLEKQYYAKNGFFADRVGLNLPHPGGGCSGCTVTNFLGEDVASHIDSIYIGIGASSQPICDQIGVFDVAVNDTLTGASFWIRQRLIADLEGNIKYYCLIEGYPGEFSPCEANWSNIDAAIVARCT